MSTACPPLRSLILGQLALVASALMLLAFCPPRLGTMILVPLVPGSGDAAIVRATLANARLVGIGPLPQSFVVWGERAQIVPAMLAQGVLVLAAPPVGCGGRKELAA